MGRNPLIAEENRRKKRKLSLIKRTQSSYNSTVTTCYDEITAKIHTISLSGYYNFKQIEKKFGKLDFDNKYFHLKKKKYNAKYNKTINGFKIKILTDPIEPGPPTISMTIIPPDVVSAIEHKAFLCNINDLFPILKTSSIEYAIDIYFENPSDVESAYEALKRNIIVPRKSTKPVIYKNSIRIGKHKIYKRGPDNNGIEHDRNRDDLNRVRIEYTEKLRKLPKYGIKYLSDFVQSPKFYDINNDKWNFKHFNVVRSKKLPGELDPYPIDGVFHSEYLAAKDKVTDRGRRAVEARAFRDLKFDLSDAMKLFDLKW